jgi:hypothetical protein
MSFIRVRSIRAAALAGVLAAACEPAAAEAPSLVVPGADVRALQGLALAAAARRGWNIAGSDAQHAVLEMRLDEPALPEPPTGASGDAIWLRLRLSFAPVAGGVRVTARAEEIRLAGLAVRRVASLDDRYRGNLIGMLEALRARWRRTPRGGGDAGADGALPAGHGGVWRYYPQQAGAARGCAGFEDAALVARPGAVERYRVPCGASGMLRLDCTVQGCRVVGGE